MSNKESELPLAYLLAGEGYFVINMDLRGHGSRVNSYDQCQVYDFTGLFTDLTGMAEDVALVLNNCGFLKRYGLKNTPVMVGGVSAGATAALYCMAKMPDLAAVVSLIGTYDLSYIIQHKKLDDFRFYSKNKEAVRYEEMCGQYEKTSFWEGLNGQNMKPVCFLNGSMDRTVPSIEREKFHNRLKSAYEYFGKEELIMTKDYAKAGHEVTHLMKKDLIQWLKTVRENYESF